MSYQTIHEWRGIWLSIHFEHEDQYKWLMSCKSGIIEATSAEDALAKLIDQLEKGEIMNES